MKTLKIFLVLALTNVSCSDDDRGPSTTWLIPLELVFDGGPGKDGIPALTDPDMKPIGDAELTYLNDDDLMVVYKNGNEIRVYSHKVMDWHEIINDQIGDDHVAITYCPLTGTGIGWGRKINGNITTYGVSGLLYETNLMPYDRLTDSYWSQMFNQCVNGELIGTQPEFFSVVQMNYGAVKMLLPNALVSTDNTGYSRDYSRYPYGSYKTNSSTLFPISNTDSRLHPKEIVRGIIINSNAVAYQFPDNGRQLITHFVDGNEVIVVSDRGNDFIVSFLSKTINTAILEFTLVTNEDSAIILEDQLGNKWDIFGMAVEGPNVGQQLEVPYSYMGYWFAFADFYPDIRIFGE